MATSLLAATMAHGNPVLPELVSFVPTGAVSFTAAQPIPSDDGRFVLFLGSVGESGLQCRQWYLRDLRAGTTELVSRNLSGGPATCPSNLMSNHTNSADISADGSVVVFDFRATNIDPAETTGRLRTYRYDRRTGHISLVLSAPPAWLGEAGPRIDASGSRILLQLGYSANDVRLGVIDQVGNVLVEVPDLTNASPWYELSGNGQYFVFLARRSGLPVGQTLQIVRKRVDTGEEIIVSSNGGQLADSTVFQPSISADGSVVAFSSFAPSLAPGLGQQILLWTEGSGNLELVSRNSEGEPALLPSWQDAPSLSADGRFVAFRSRAFNFPGGRDALPDYPQVYVRDRIAGRTTLISRTASGAGARYGSSDGGCEDALQALGQCFLRLSPRITADGSAVFFHSSSPDLHPSNQRTPQAFRFDYARAVGGDGFGRPVPTAFGALVALFLFLLGFGMLWHRASSWGRIRRPGHSEAGSE